MCLCSFPWLLMELAVVPSHVWLPDPLRLRVETSQGKGLCMVMFPTGHRADIMQAEQRNKAIDLEVET